MTHNNTPHVLTIDVEDWFHCLEPVPCKWSQFARRIESETSVLLKLLETFRAKATFFVLGDVAAHSPDLVREIASQGHEIGTHGMLHRFIYHQTPDEFRQDLQQSLELLTSITGQDVHSYRAPYFSITGRTLWALEILKANGIRYDSSVFPAHNPRYGISSAKRVPHKIRPGIWEWPVSTLPTPLGNIPCGGGVYLRLLPRSFLRAAITAIERRKEPVVIYLHPWELDPHQPKHRTDSWFLNFRHYYGLDKTADKLAELLGNGSYTTLASAAQNYGSEAS